MSAGFIFIKYFNIVSVKKELKIFDININRVDEKAEKKWTLMITLRYLRNDIKNV